MKLKTATLVKPKATPKPESKAPDNPRRHPDSMPTSLAANPVGMSEERKSLYREYTEGVDSGEITPPPEGEEKVPGSEISDTPPEEGATETSSDNEEQERKPEEELEPKGEETTEEESPETKKEDKHTMVPHAALHEERQEHKETKAKLNKAVELIEQTQKQLTMLMEENKKLRSDEQPEKKDDGPIDDIEKYVRDLKDEVQQVKLENKKLREERVEELTSQSESKRQAIVNSVAEDLKGDGYPGFEEFLGKVAEHIEMTARGNPTKMAAMDNPEGWKKVYKESVFPKVASIFGVKAKEVKRSEKEELKGKANLVGKGGQPPVKKEDEPKKPWDLGDYYKMRQEKRPS